MEKPDVSSSTLRVIRQRAHARTQLSGQPVIRCAGGQMCEGIVRPSPAQNMRLNYRPVIANEKRAP